MGGRSTYESTQCEGTLVTTNFGWDWTKGRLGGAHCRARFYLLRPHLGDSSFWRKPHICQRHVQSHDILYRVSQDIPYTPVRAKRAREVLTGWLGGRWTYESNE